MQLTEDLWEVESRLALFSQKVVATAVQELLSRKNKLDELLVGLKTLLSACENPAFEEWDRPQRENRAILLKASSSVFHFLDHLGSVHPDEVSEVVDSLLEDTESVNADLVYECTLAIIVASNRLKTRSVESLVVLSLVERIKAVWDHVLSEEDREEVRSFALSEKPLLLIKNNLSASQVSEILNELTRDTCPIKSKIPPLLIVTMETLAATGRFAAWVGDTSDSVMKSDPSTWIPSLPSVFSEQNSHPAHSKQTFIKKKDASMTRPSSNVILAPTTIRREVQVGIDMLPVPSGKASRKVGIHIGAPPESKKRISFKVHGDTQWSRLGSLFRH